LPDVVDLLVDFVALGEQRGDAGLGVGIGLFRQP
jgi:hypothetical protein